MERKVVVVGSISVWQRDQGKMFAARFEPLKLTSYGRTKDEAERAVREQFKRFVHANREIGVLEKLLDKVEAEWYWEDEYPSDTEAPIEYLDGPADAAHAASKPKGGYTRVNSDLAIAA
ncbi:MAG: hypothetical protein BZY87_05505 [SAR202 cluster bacterium Io17-Chloro-G6]|nr:MAG: hypothetical protein BZY87_05505 [SAR202 cluster bacterium Io17-Chloro-G6]